MRKLRQFQEFGHDVTFLIGTFTSLIGDPSDKDKAREQLTRQQVEDNARTYAEQAFKILDPQLTRVRRNDEWLSTLDFADIIRLASNFTVQQFLVRENFAKRIDAGEPIYLHELFYGLMQGYDAVAQEADVQVGGQDQLFNILVAGRKLQEALGQKPQIAIIMGESLPGTDGEIKMSKSLGNHIPLLSEPWDMFGKVMSVPDKAMPIYHKLILGWSPAQVKELEDGLDGGRAASQRSQDAPGPRDRLDLPQPGSCGRSAADAGMKCSGAAAAFPKTSPKQRWRRRSESSKFCGGWRWSAAARKPSG